MTEQADKIAELAKLFGNVSAGKPAELIIPAMATALLFTIVQAYPQPEKFRKIIKGVMDAMDKDARAIWKQRQGQ
jgi:hypothetical protein